MAAKRYIFWLALAELLFYVSGFIVHAVAGRVLGPAEYGTYGLIVTLTILIASLIGNGLPIAMSKFLSEALAKKPHLIRTIKHQTAVAQIVLIGTMTGIFYFGAPLIAWVLRDMTLVPLLKISAFIIPCFAADAFYFYYYTGIHQFNMQSILKMFRSVLRMTVIVGLGYLFSLQGFIAGYIVVPFSIFVIAFFVDQAIYARRFPNDPQEDFDVKKVLRYAVPVTGFLLLYQAMISLNLFTVKAILRDDYLTGLFNGALTIAQIPSYLFYALTIVLLPVISHSAAHEHREKMAETVRLSLRLMTLLLVPVIALIIGYAEPLLVFFFGAKFAAGAAALRVLSIGVGSLTLFYVMSFAFQGAGLANVPVKIALAGMLINATLNVILVPKMQLVGSGLATIMTAVMVLAAMFFYLRQKFDHVADLSGFAKMIFSGGVILGLTFILPGQGLLFIFFGALLFATYLFLLYLLRELKPDDLKLFREMLPGRRSK